MAALANRVRIGSRVLFRQVRPGLQGHPFTLLKFRTKKDSRDAHGRLLVGAERITPLGSFLRRFSVDELPQLRNVLRGDMSLGGQPMLMEYLNRYTPEEA